MPFQWTAWELVRRLGVHAELAWATDRMRGELAPPAGVDVALPHRRVWRRWRWGAAAAGCARAVPSRWTSAPARRPDLRRLLHQAGGQLPEVPRRHAAVLVRRSPGGSSTGLATYAGGSDWSTVGCRRGGDLLPWAPCATAGCGRRPTIWEPARARAGAVLLAARGGGACWLPAPAPTARARARRWCAALSSGWAIAVDGAQARADYSTSYYYGTRGQREVAALLDAPGLRRPLGGPEGGRLVRANQRYIDADTFWWLVLAEDCGSTARCSATTCAWWFRGRWTRGWRLLLGSAPRRYEPVGQVADYAVWVRRDTLSTVAQLSPRDTGTP